MRVIAEVTHKGKPLAIQMFSTVKEARAAISRGTDTYGPLSASLWRVPVAADLDPFGLDVPTWRIIRTDEQFIRSEDFSETI